MDGSVYDGYFVKTEYCSGTIYSQWLNEKNVHWNSILKKDDPKIEGSVIPVLSATEKLKEYCETSLSSMGFDKDMKMVHGTIKKYEPVEIDCTINCRTEKFNFLAKVLSEGRKELKMTYSGVIHAFKGYTSEEKPACLVKFKTWVSRVRRVCVVVDVQQLLDSLPNSPMNTLFRPPCTEFNLHL